MSEHEKFFAQETAPRAESPRAQGGASTVSIARTTERFRDARSVHALVKEAVDRLGGMEAFVHAGQTVLIKPNQTGYFLADEGKTTDPRVVAALIRLAREAGAVRVIVGESSGMDATKVVLAATGMAAVAKEAGAEVVSFDDCPTRVIDVPGGRALQRIEVPFPLLEADVIVNAFKGKTHHMDPITGAIKNWVGAIPMRVRVHHHDTECFREYPDLMSVVRPALNVCDAIVVGEGDGPVANTPRWCGCVLASRDPVAIDVTVCRLFSLDPGELRFAKEAAEAGLGVGDPGAISIVGAPLEEARIEVRRPRRGWDYFPFNVFVGGGVTYAGTLGHWKSIADAFLADGTWVKVLATSGMPTFLIGDVEDPHFERHVRQGPYFVIDDAAPARYRLDPRVHYLRGHPVLHTMLPEILKGLGLTIPGNAVKRGGEVARAVEARLLYVPRRRVAREVAALVLGAAALGVASFALARAIARVV